MSSVYALNVFGASTFGAPASVNKWTRLLTPCEIDQGSSSAHPLSSSSSSIGAEGVPANMVVSQVPDQEPLPAPSWIKIAPDC